MTGRYIRGHFVDERELRVGFANKLYIQQQGDRLIDPETGATLTCEQFRNDAPLISNGVWFFMPDEGELERCEIVPTLKA